MYDDCCPICLEHGDPMVQLSCCHKIHEACLQKLVHSRLVSGHNNMTCPLCRKKENFRVVMGKVKHTIFINVMNPFHICDVDRLTFRVSWPRGSKPLMAFHATCHCLSSSW